MTNGFGTQFEAIGELKRRVMRLPVNFSVARRRSTEAQQQVREAEKRAKDAKGEIEDAETSELLKASIAQAADGKPKYTNEKARKAAVDEALRGSATHKERVQRFEQAELALLNARLEAQKCEDDVKNLEAEQYAFRAAVDLTVAEIQLLVHGR